MNTKQFKIGDVPTEDTPIGTVITKKNSIGIDWERQLPEDCCIVDYGDTGFFVATFVKNGEKRQGHFDNSKLKHYQIVSLPTKIS